MSPVVCPQELGHWAADLHQSQSAHCPDCVLHNGIASVSPFKGTVSRGFFASGFFSCIRFPRAPEFSIMTVSIFFKNSLASQGAPPISMPVSLVLLILLANLSTIPPANLPPVSMTPAANCHQYQWHWRQICHCCKWHRWQTMGTIINFSQIWRSLERGPDWVPDQFGSLPQNPLSVSRYIYTQPNQNWSELILILTGN